MRGSDPTFDGQSHQAFVWNTGTGAVDILPGESAVAFAGNDVVGTAQGKPALWTGGAGTPAILPGLAGLAQGIANGGTGPDEVVGTVSAFGIPGTERPFLCRRFRRDELDPASTVVVPVAGHTGISPCRGNTVLRVAMIAWSTGSPGS